jgi:diaminopimelate epimerase
MIELFKYQGAGNDFILADGRKSAGKNADFVDEDFIRRVCDRRYGIGADGFMILEDSENYGFKMVYYNSDGSGGMMCGNGGRCIVAFAAHLGVERLDFEAADGPHDAQILPDGSVRLKMKDVSDVAVYDEVSYRLDTGTKHLVRFVGGLESYDVVGEGRELRYREDFAPIGTNVNFVEPKDGVLAVRTYEKGVEDETYACGTGIVASAISAFARGVAPSRVEGERVSYDIKALRDRLSVDFTGELPLIKDVWLTGPAQKVAVIYI